MDLQNYLCIRRAPVGWLISHCSLIPSCPVQVLEYHRLKGVVVKQSSALGQKMERLNQEQRTDEEALEQAVMKKEELLNRQAQLREQR